MLRTEDGRLSGVMYTSEVLSARCNDSSISTTAHLFQAKLTKIADVRVTVIGESIFATRIDNPGELDWRRSHHNITHRPYKHGRCGFRAH